MTDPGVERHHPRAPKGLSPRAKAWWKAVVSAYTLRADELILLERACKTMDRVDELEAAMEGQPLLVKGSMGQERENPLLAEARMQSVLLNRTLAQLKLPDDGHSAGINRYRSAAQSRWTKHMQSEDPASRRWRHGE